MTIFVANFSYETEEADLKELFEDFGKVNDVQIYRDFRTCESLGYGFVVVRVLRTKRGVPVVMLHSESVEGRRGHE